MDIMAQTVLINVQNAIISTVGPMVGNVRSAILVPMAHIVQAHALPIVIRIVTNQLVTAHLA